MHTKLQCCFQMFPVTFFRLLRNRNGLSFHLVFSTPWSLCIFNIVLKVPVPIQKAPIGGVVLSRLNWKGVIFGQGIIVLICSRLQKFRDSGGNQQGIWSIWWVISSLMPSIFRIWVSKAWESKMWSRLCYTYIYVHATPSWSISFTICCRKNNQLKPDESSVQCESYHFQKNMLNPNPKVSDLDQLLLHPPFWDSLPQCTAQVRHGCLERLKSTQLKSPHSWPLHVKSTSTQNILSFL